MNQAKPEANTAAKSAYTAARIATWLGKTPQSVRKALREIPGTVQIVNGIEAEAWKVEQLPQAMREQLSREARRLRFLNVETMLANSRTRWEPRVSLDRIEDGEIAKAKNLRDALKPFLVSQHNCEETTTELERRGVEAYSNHFDGKQISGRYWRELVARTIERDGGAEDWERLAIYLPDRPALKRGASEIVLSVMDREFGDLADITAGCANPAQPSEIEKVGIWRRTFERYDHLVGKGSSPKRAARMVRSFLFAKAPALAPTRDALRKAFDRRLEDWLKAHDPSCLIDKRADNGGDEFVEPQGEMDRLEFLIAFQYGDFDQAWKHVWRTGELSEATRAHYPRNRGRYCPKRWKAKLGMRPYYIYVLARRRRDFNSRKAHFQTIRDGLDTLDIISADDLTGPVWFYYQETPESAPRMTRGQILIFIDLVSKRILGWSLQPEKNYNALVIYTQTAKVFADKGIPRMLLFEHGIWEKARIVAGSAPHSINEVTEGLKRFGVEFAHANTPEGKSEVENVMARVQDLMEGEPGYCGRDERRDRPDWIKRQLEEIGSKLNPVHPSKYFYSFEQWNQRLGKIFEDYNRLEQQGDWMAGRSPDAIYYNNWNEGDPPSRLGPDLHYRLARAKYEKTLGPDGFSITSGNRTFKYFGPEINSLDLIGHKVLVWFNPEFPDVATITDMKERNPISVPLHTGVPRMERLTDPQGTKLAEACERREGQVKEIVARYNVLKDKFEMPYRQNLVAAQQRDLGTEMETQQTAVRARKREHHDRVQEEEKLSKRLGFLEEMETGDPDTIEALRRLQVAREAESKDAQ